MERREGEMMERWVQEGKREEGDCQKRVSENREMGAGG